MTKVDYVKQITKEYQDSFNKFDFYDANSWIGKQFLFPLAEDVNINTLLKIHKSYRITNALISHWYGFTGSAKEGNKYLFEAVKGINNCKIIITGLPTFPKEDFGISDDFANSFPESIAGIRLFPKTHHFSFTKWCIGELIEIMSKHKLPLFLWHTEINWNEVYEIAKGFKNLNIVIESQYRKILYDIRSVLTLMKECSNVYLEISNLSIPMMLEYIVKNIGSERLVFGTFLPVNDPFVTIGMLIKAQITLEEKKLIAGDNLKRIIK